MFQKAFLCKLERRFGGLADARGFISLQSLRNFKTFIKGFEQNIDNFKQLKPSRITSNIL